jgi:hypothetical protein
MSEIINKVFAQREKVHVTNQNEYVSYDTFGRLNKNNTIGFLGCETLVDKDVKRMTGIS